MQRTVRGTKFTYAVNSINENGEITAELRTIEVPETDKKKALRMAFKKAGTFQPLTIESTEDVWVIEDAVFFQYAHKVDKNKQKE